MLKRGDGVRRRELLKAALACAITPGMAVTMACGAWPGTLNAHEVADRDAPNARRPADGGGATLPVRRDMSGRLLVPVTVNRAGPFYFVLDTGATRSALSRGLAGRLRLSSLKAQQVPPVRSNDALLNDTTGRSLVPTVHVERLEAGALRIENIDLAVPASLNGVDGVLGADVLATARIDIDFASSRILLGDTSLPPTPHVVRAEKKFGNLLYVPATVNGTRVSAIVDTGAGRTLGNLALLGQLQNPNAPLASHDEAQVRGLGDRSQAARIHPNARIELAGVLLDALDLPCADLHVFRAWGFTDSAAVLLGMDALGSLSRLAIDYEHSEVRVWR